MQSELHSKRIWYPRGRTFEEVRNMETFTLDGHNNTQISHRVVDELFVELPVVMWTARQHPMNCSLSIN